MNDYVIINGTNSNTITGLAINLLPPISKPPLRVMTEEIDGRDGDINTDLGYGAYDKTMTISLWGNFNIDTIIGFFNSEGTIVFSNEPDKYYNFKIINQIDYEKLLKFKTAEITLHCQPFKYPLVETPIEITNEYVEGEGENINLNNTKASTMEIDLKGNTSQTGTPTPSSPINVNVVSGDNILNIVGKNFFNIQGLVKGRLDNGVVGYVEGTTALTLNDNSFTFTTNANYRGVVSDYIVVKANTDYYMNISNVRTGIGLGIACYDKNKTFLSNPTSVAIDDHTVKITTPADTKYCRVGVQLSASGTITITNPQLKEENTSYEPYQGQIYPINFGVENLFDKSGTIINGYFDSSTTTITSASSNRTAYCRVKPNTTYCISKLKSIRSWVGTSQNEPTIGTSISNIKDIGGGGYDGTKINGTITTGANDNYIVINYTNTNSETGDIPNTILNSIQVEKGSKANSYTPYGTTPIELNKIGTYQDYIYKPGDKWYLHKEVGKSVFTGASSENWNRELPGNNIVNHYIKINEAVNNANSPIYNNMALYNSTISGNDNNHKCYISGSNNLNFRADEIATTNDLRTLLGTTNMVVYYILKNATEEEITNTTLINQLEALKGATSYEGQTNISQVNNDLPFILSASALKTGSGEAVVNNIGNIYAKPTIDIEGTGTIGIYKNGVQHFEVDMSNDNEIIIDTENMEAYYDGILKNRKVIGDYNKFTIDKGNNNIEITGELTKATITKYTRYL